MPERSLVVVQLTAPAGKAEQIEDSIREAIRHYDDGRIGFRLTSGTPPEDILKAIALFQWPEMSKE